ncbi:MAG: hypothetical protein ACRC9Q_05705 [Bacteroidales bacterium]
MDKLLICLSEGKRALSILTYARDFARNFGIPYEVLFVKRLTYVEDEMFFLEMPMFYRVSRPDEESEIVNIMDEAGKLVDSDVKFTLLNDSADLIEVLQERYDNFEYSMLALPHSLEMMNWPFLDSLNKFIHKMRCPILLVDPSAQFHEIKEVVYASNYLATDAHVLKRFQKISSNKISKIDIVHVSFSDNFTERMLEKGFEAYIKEHIPEIEIKVHHVPLVSSQATTVDLFLEEVKKFAPDLLILMKEERSGWEDFLSKSFTLSTVKKTTIPMLILHEKYSRVNAE